MGSNRIASIGLIDFDVEFRTAALSAQAGGRPAGQQQNRQPAVERAAMDLTHLLLLKSLWLLPHRSRSTAAAPWWAGSGERALGFVQKANLKESSSTTIQNKTKLLSKDSGNVPKDIFDGGSGGVSCVCEYAEMPIASLAS